MTRRAFTDTELTDQSFPDPRMPEQQHRPARHAWYRRKAAEGKQPTAIQLYSRGWFYLLWDLWTGNKIEEEL